MTQVVSLSRIYPLEVSPSSESVVDPVKSSKGQRTVSRNMEFGSFRCDTYWQALIYPQVLCLMAFVTLIKIENMGFEKYQ